MFRSLNKTFIRIEAKLKNSKSPLCFNKGLLE